MIINHNIPALNAYNVMRFNSTQMSKSLEKLSSGLRINRAADDAAGLAISEKMRAQIRGLDQATRNAQDGISLIQTAEGALSETHSILQRMRELSVQAANDTYTSSDRLNIQSEIDQLTSEVDRIAGTTQFNGKSLLDGSTSALVSSDKLTTKIFMRDGLRVLDQFGQKAPGGGNYKLDIETQAGVNQVQKSDIFKVKHNTTTDLCFQATSGITNFSSTTAPTGAYTVDTVRISTGTAITTGCSCVGVCIQTATAAACGMRIFYDQSNSTYAGATGNCITIYLVCNGACSSSTASFDAASKTLTITVCSFACSTFDCIAAAICNSTTTAGFCYCLTTALCDFTGCAGNTYAFTGGTDTVAANSSITGQYQSNTANGTGLIKKAGLSDTAQAYNASMYFEVLCVDTTNNQVGVRVYSHQYSACGTYAAFQQDLTLNANCTAQGANVTVGNVVFSAANFLLGQTCHFSVGDKFAVDVAGSQSINKEKIDIRNDTGNTKEWTYDSGTWTNTSGTCVLRSYFLSNTSGEVKSAIFTPTISTFFCEYTGICSFVQGAGITAVVADDLQAGMNWTITGCTATGAATSMTATVEKTFSACGSVAVSGCTGASNASLLFEVVRVDGTGVEVRATGFAMAAGLVAGCVAICNVDTNVCFTIGTAQVAAFAGNMCMTLSGTWKVGDKFTVFQTACANAAADDALIFSKQQRDSVSGCVIAGTTLTRSVVLTDACTNRTNFAFMELDANTGTVTTSNLVLTRGVVASGASTFETTDKNAANYKQALSIGDVARSETKLYDTDKFWDASGNFILANPQTITLVQGDGQKTSFTVTAADTFGTVRDKLNSAIGTGLGQTTIVGESNAQKFATFVDTATCGGSEAVKGTFVIRSAVAGKNGEITFVGDDNVIAALSLANIQNASDNNFFVDVKNAHTLCNVATCVRLADNNLIGIVHKNVDVQFAAGTGVKVTWDDTNKAFTLCGGSVNACSTYVHLADRTMVLQVGANQKQDIGVGIGNMGTYALGINNVQVTSNTLANEAIGKIDSAINRVSSQRSTLGAMQNRLDHTINNLSVTTENLTAAESRIRDVDMAKQMMEFTKYNVLNQAATAMLAQANQLPQAVLQLLR